MSLTVTRAVAAVCSTPTSTEPPGAATSALPSRLRQDLADPVRVGVHRDGRRGVDRQPHPRVVELGLEARAGPPHEVAEVHRDDAELGPPLLGAGQRGEVLREAAEPAQLLPDRPQGRLVRLEDPVDQAFDVALRRREGGAHLVGDLAEEADPAGLGLGERRRQGVDVARERRELRLGRHRDPGVVPAGGDLPGGGPDRVERGEQPAGDEGGDRPGSHRGDERADGQGRVERAEEGLAHRGLPRGAAVPCALARHLAHPVLEELRGEQPDGRPGDRDPDREDDEVGGQQPDGQPCPHRGAPTNL